MNLAHYNQRANAELYDALSKLKDKARKRGEATCSARFTAFSTISSLPISTGSNDSGRSSRNHEFSRTRDSHHMSCSGNTTYGKILPICGKSVSSSTHRSSYGSTSVPTIAMKSCSAIAILRAHRRVPLPAGPSISFSCIRFITAVRSRRCSTHSAYRTTRRTTERLSRPPTEQFEALGIRAHFELVINAESAGISKPATAFSHLACFTSTEHARLPGEWSTCSFSAGTYEGLLPVSHAQKLRLG